MEEEFSLIVNPQKTDFKDYLEHRLGLKFSHIAAMYHAQYDAMHTKEDLKQALLQPKLKDIRIIEVFTNRQRNSQIHRSDVTAISKELDVVWKA